MIEIGTIANWLGVTPTIATILIFASVIPIAFGCTWVHFHVGKAIRLWYMKRKLFKLTGKKWMPNDE